MSYLRQFVPALLVCYLVWLPAWGVCAEPEGKPVRKIWFPRFSPDGKLLATAHGDWDASGAGEIRVWEVESGKPKFIIPNLRGVRTVAWSPKGTSLAAGNYGGELRFYDPKTGKQTDEMKLPSNVEVAQFTPDGTRLVTAIGNGTIRVWDLAKKKEAYAWPQAHKGGIWGMTLAPDGKTLASGGKDRVLRVFDIESQKLLHELKQPGEINGLAFTSDSKTLFAGCTDSEIHVIDAVMGKELRQLSGHQGGSITDLQISPDGKVLASCGADRTVRLWDLSDFEKPELKTTLRGHAEIVFGVAISPNGKWLASVDWNERVELLDLATQEEKWAWER